MRTEAASPLLARTGATQPYTYHVTAVSKRDQRLTGSTRRSAASAASNAAARGHGERPVPAARRDPQGATSYSRRGSPGHEPVAALAAWRPRVLAPSIPPSG